MNQTSTNNISFIQITSISPPIQPKSTLILSCYSNKPQLPLSLSINNPNPNRTNVFCILPILFHTDGALSEIEWCEALFLLKRFVMEGKKLPGIRPTGGLMCV